ncbi:cation channel domain-containing protein, putative [Eimeria mitis]|uniref:Cation channel domain-containing protein, putative n=1 Tax=Eimeria mitis TaxID=44415 RepID=U6K2P1_9EIME|nr:cation channel domain-containing protein, putative [Eimeria mitis]CDJ30038.1 cation channel domain-containing protein, putative [Eimeria mitis]
MKDFLNLGKSYRVITILICVFLVALLSVFVVNLFVGIIVDVLDQEQANMEYTGGLRSATVLRWNEMQRAIFTSNLITDIVENRGGDKRGGVLHSEGVEPREWLKRIITSKPFDAAVAVISLLSCLTMLAAGAWAESDIRWSFPNYQIWIFWINAVVVLAYVIEQCVRFAVFKMALFRKGIYIMDLAVATVAFLLLMNLFTSTVLKGYVDAKRNQSLWKVAQLQHDLLNKWRLRELKLSWLPVHVAVQVLAELPPPIGFKDLYVDLGPRRMQAILANLAVYPLPVHENKVHIRDMVLTTTCRACEAHAQRRGPLAAFDPLNNQQKVELNPRLVNAWMSHFSDAAVTPEFNILQYLAALQIQSFWRTQRLLQRNSVPDQIRYMQHLLFLLETSGPICARRRSRNDSRRSTLRRKRGTKTGGSFMQKSAVLTQLGTFKLDPESRDRLKSVWKNVASGFTGKNQGRGQTTSAVPGRIQRHSTSYEDRFAQEDQRQRQKLLLHRSEASECLTDLVEVGKDLAKEQKHQRQEAHSWRAEYPEEISCPSKSSASIVAATQLDSPADSSIAVTGSRLSVTSTTRLPLGATSAADSSAEDLHHALDRKATTAPRRSSMRAPQPFLPAEQPRRSLRIVPAAPKLQRISTPNADRPDNIVPPRRKGQSVQFTGVQKVELQRLLAPALAQHSSSDSEGDEDSSS